MKITKKQLENLIQEELQKQIDEEGVFTKFINTGVNKLKTAFGGAKKWEKEAEKTAEPEAGQPAEPEAGQPAAKEEPAAKPDVSELAAAQKQVQISTQDVPVPQLMLIQQALKNTIRNALLASVPKEKLNVVMPAVMGYINRLPKMSRIIAETISEGDAAAEAAKIAALKNKLAAKHGKGGPMIANNLKRAIEKELSKFTSGSVANPLMDIAKKMPPSKETQAYMKSLVSNPKAHKQAFMMNSKLITDNIVSLVLAAMPKAAAKVANLPSEKAPEKKSEVESKPLDDESFLDVKTVGISESRRMKKLAGILKD